MKEWGKLDLENQREPDRYKADLEADKNAKSSEEIAELTKGVTVDVYDTCGNKMGSYKS